MKVGDEVAHVATLLGQVSRVVLTTKIVRETRTQWVTERDQRWSKKTGAQVPQYGPEPRFIMSTEDARVALEKRR